MSDKEILLQGFYIDQGVDMTQAPISVTLRRNQIRYECQRDWELLWDEDFIFAGCNGGIGSDLNRLEEIVKAAQARLEQYNKRIG